MKHVLRLILIAAFSGIAYGQANMSKDEIRRQLDALNAACDKAREERLAPLRKQYIEECISKERNDPDYCRRFYADYGARSGKRPPLFNDLPECVTAWEFQRKHRER